ncbi:hypothetical protein [Streptomyces sp. 35G-GA-8]|uniref:hypothetical protein n=1 Tax=Streptomyces sp. 35G-GA-8 TaxID=2939434 RepID=UPI00201EDE30|nr:hypothetical protein [Streptomyces sp. 35G-GA-8]MCL7382179.1 hypothetical protein [Streptomyces sp. 35G-GA-8]
METVKITWTQDGSEERWESAVSYSPAAAEDYKRYKEAQDGVSDVQIIAAQP